MNIDSPSTTAAREGDKDDGASGSSRSGSCFSPPDGTALISRQSRRHSSLMTLTSLKQPLVDLGEEDGDDYDDDDDDDEVATAPHQDLNRRGGGCAGGTNGTSSRTVTSAPSSEQLVIDSTTDTLTSINAVEDTDDDAVAAADASGTSIVETLSSATKRVPLAAASVSTPTTSSLTTSNLSSSGGNSLHGRVVDGRVAQAALEILRRHFDEHSAFGNYSHYYHSHNLHRSCSSSSRSFSGGRSMLALPRFDRNELVLGKRLGKGSFSDVDAIRGITISERKLAPVRVAKRSASSPSLSSAPPSFPVPRRGGLRREDTVALNDNESRQFIAQHCFRNNGAPRYVLKSVRRDVLGNYSQSILGLCDLAVETMVLSKLVHPNIIKLRAVSTADPCSGNYFLVLDRLQETLQQRIETTWTKRERRLYSPWGRRVRDRTGQKRLEFFEHRLERAFDLSAAIQYIHEKRIIHRDIKPDNIGFDIRGTILI
jgi:Protein kinase domain